MDKEHKVSLVICIKLSIQRKPYLDYNVGYLIRSGAAAAAEAGSAGWFLAVA